MSNSEKKAIERIGKLTEQMTETEKRLLLTFGEGMVAQKQLSEKKK